MRIEGGKVAVEMPRSSSRKSRRRKKEAAPPPPAVQRLFETCREVFFGCAAGVVPSQEGVGLLKAVLDDMKPADVGLAQNLPYFLKDNAKGAPPVTYLHLYECDKFSVSDNSLGYYLAASFLDNVLQDKKYIYIYQLPLILVAFLQIGIFCLPPSAVIPLHNHPGMTVFSKILFGSMHIKSYDWVDVPQNSVETATTSHSCEIPAKVKLAKLKKNSVFSAPCETSVLYPMAGGNLHCFTAITSCAVLDVLGPPYSDAEGRHCTYYKDFPYLSFSVDGISMAGEEGEHAWIEERDKPDDFVVVGAKYFGPKIVVQ